MPSKPSKWLPLYRALKMNGYVKEIRPQISKLLRESDSADRIHLPTLIDLYRTQSEYESILKECYPGTVLQGQEMLKRVANVVGLELPKIHKE